MSSRYLKTTLKAPEKPTHLPKESQWLAGEGAGSWFHMTTTKNKLFFKISRFSPEGKLECEGIFYQDHHFNKFDFGISFSFTHLSHCEEVSILQKNDLLKFKRFSDVEN